MLGSGGMVSVTVMRTPVWKAFSAHMSTQGRAGPLWPLAHRRGPLVHIPKPSEMPDIGSSRD